MAISDQEKQVILSSAMIQYIFNKTFADHNDGKVFDMANWGEEIDKITDDPMFAISQEKQEELAKCIINLDKYAADASDLSKPADSNQPKLQLV